MRNGDGPEEFVAVCAMLGLPFSISTTKNYSRLTQGIYEKIIDAIETSVAEALLEEIKLTYNSKQRDVPFDVWLNMKPEEREVIKICVSYDMGWQKRSSGKQYNSLSGHAFMIGCRTKKVVGLILKSKACAVCNHYKNAKSSKVRDHDCVMNCQNSSKAMEADGCLELVEHVSETYQSSVYVYIIVSDDDSTMKAIVNHESNGAKKGRLKPNIPVPKWKADPTHRTKVVAKPIYALASMTLKESKVRRLDAMRVKKNYAYFIKQTRCKSFEEMKQQRYAPIEHIFDNHEFCHAEWCHRKREIEAGVKESSKGVGYYRDKSNVVDREVYDQIKKAYSPYVTDERLEECYHEYDTQKNEAMNTAVARVAPKNRTYCRSKSLMARICLVVGEQNMGHEEFWKRLLAEYFGITPSASILDYFDKKNMLWNVIDPTNLLQR